VTRVDSGGPTPDGFAAPPGNAVAGRERAVGRSALVFALLTALAVGLTWPATAHLGSVVVDLGDPLLTTWILAWDVHALTMAPFRFFDANMFHPHRFTLTYTEHLLGLVPLVLPARLAGAGALLAHNLVWLATFPLTGVTMFWLVRHLTGHAGAAAVAAVLYAFSPFRFGQLGHIQVLSHQWLPLVLLGLHRAAQSGGRWRDLWLAAIALGLQALSSGYQAYLAAIAVAVFVAWLALPADRPSLGRLIARGTVAAAVVGVLVVPFFLPYRAVRNELGLSRSREEIAQYAARPMSYLAAPAVSRWLGTATAPYRGTEAALFPGLVTLGLAIVGAAGAWQRRGDREPPAQDRRPWPRVLDLALAGALLVTVTNWLLVGGLAARVGPIRFSQRHFGAPFLGLAIALAARRIIQGHAQPIRGLGWLRRLGWPRAAGCYVGLTVVGVIASFGPELEIGAGLRLAPLYARLYDLVPGFDALRVPGRFGILVTTGLAGLAGFGAAAIARRIARRRWQRVTLAVLAGLAALEAWAVPLPLMTIPDTPGPADRWLADRRGPEAVVVLPMYEARAIHLESLRLFGSTTHWHPLVNGYAGIFPPSYFADVDTLNAFPAPAAVGRLRHLYVRYVVVHLGQYHEAPRARLEAALEVLPPGIIRVAAFEHTQIFEIGPEGGRGSDEPRGAEERPRAADRRRIDEARRLERVEPRRDREQRVKAVTFRGEPLPAALLPIDQHHEILDHEARRHERLDGLELRRPVRDDVVDHHDPLAGLERALDPPARAVRLLLAARVDQRDAARQARGHGER
jgi:hypothetical protein